ncbi:hypothetical protein ACHAWF_002071 [Thalassiosira exigua]
MSIAFVQRLRDRRRRPKRNLLRSNDFFGRKGFQRWKGSAAVALVLSLAAYMACPVRNRDSDIAATPPGTPGLLLGANSDKGKHWEFRLLDGGDQVDCRIFTAPIVRRSDLSFPSSNQVAAEGSSSFDVTDQYVIHVHGLHHTGTGFLRKILYDALNKEFSPTNNGASKSPAASVHDSLRPHRRLLDEARGDPAKLRVLTKRYSVPEAEGAPAVCISHIRAAYESDGAGGEGDVWVEDEERGGIEGVVAQRGKIAVPGRFVRYGGRRRRIEPPNDGRRRRRSTPRTTGRRRPVPSVVALLGRGRDVPPPEDSDVGRAVPREN